MSKEAAKDTNHKDFKQQILMPKPAQTLQELRESISKHLYDIGVIEFQMKFDHPRRLRELYEEINKMDKEAQKLMKQEQKIHEEKMEAMKQEAELKAKETGVPLPTAMKLEDVPPSILAAAKNSPAKEQAMDS